jgi:uncharacterized membrane protein
MRVHRIVAYAAVLLMLLMLMPIYNANAQDFIEYKIKINPDNSAIWQITKVTDINAPIDTWESFQNKIFGLADAAAVATKRPMAIDENSLQINNNLSTSSKTTEYMFIWQNFSSTEGADLVFGDVFEVSGFFSQLYGEASLQISYPQNFAVKSVTPEPNSRDNAACTLRWYRTQDLENIKVHIVLAPNSGNTIDNGISQQSLIVAGVSAAGLAVALTATLFIVKRKKRKAEPELNSGLPVFQIEKEEDKIINVLSASKGSMRQSDICEQCRFSKAKTSQLLAVLEKRGVITRYKSGRDKIVTLKERGKGEKQQ